MAAAAIASAVMASEAMAQAATAPADAVAAQHSFRVPDGQQMSTGRSIAAYAEKLMFPLAELMRGRTLDIGCGFSGFGRSARQLGADVIELEPKFASKPFMEKYRWDKRGAEAPLVAPLPRDTESKVAAINEALPFKDGTFTTVLACYSSLFQLSSTYSDDPVAFRLAAHSIVSEVVRILKPGGSAYMTITRQTLGIVREQTAYFPSASFEAIQISDDHERMGVSVLKISKRE